MTHQIVSLSMTCWACPSQWSGMTAEGLEVYGRYRWGYLSLDINDQQVYGRQIGDGMDGVMDTGTFLELVGEVAQLAPGVAVDG